VLTPEEAREEAARAQQIEEQVEQAESAAAKPRRKKP